jgi:glycosyltransferase involved in cell wall biosynthesis
MPIGLAATAIARDRRSPLFDGATPRQSGPLRLAIVSTYDEMCGIAGYTRAVEQQLRPHAEVTVFDLDQYLLRSPHARVQRLADRHIKDIAARLRDFDSVNIQLEYGTLGRTPSQIMRRFKRLVAAAPAVSVTFHTILGHDPLDWAAIGRSLITGRISSMFRIIGSYRRNRNLGVRTYQFLHARQRVQPVNAIVHTKRDARLLRDVFRIRNVDHHPLSFVGAEQAAGVREAAVRDRFPILATLPADAKLIGSFGFLSPYKGFETALRALHYLPDDHHLLIFGGIHPQAIKREQALDPYIQTLFDESHIGQTILDTVSAKGTPLTLNLDAASKDLLSRHPEDLHRRVHFLGVHNDENFMRAMALCDVVVLPYLEVGQSSSGPIAMALEMGCRVLASRTLAFLQFARYHPDQIEFFDIGNYAELADLIRAGTPAPGGARQLAFNTGTNAALYLEANQPRSRRWGGQRGKQPQPAATTPVAQTVESVA